MVLGAQPMVTSVPKKEAGPAAAIQDISASLGAAVGIMFLGSLHGRLQPGRGRRSIRSRSAADLDAATNSPGGAVAVAEAIGGTTGAELLPVIEQAWSWGTVTAYAAALVAGVMTRVITMRGLRGTRAPSDEESGGDRGRCSHQHGPRRPPRTR